MSTIPASAIVSVNPSVLNAGGNALDIIAMVLTKNTRVPVGEALSFPSALSVSQFFGESSQEAAGAAVYFAGFDTSTAKPGSILFAQYPAVAVSAYLRGGNVSGMPLSTIQALNGSLTVPVDGYAHTAATLTLSGATSYSAAAALIQAALTASEPTECTFAGSITGNVLTVTNVASGTLSVGQTVVGPGVPGATVITALGTGEGLDGTYTISTTETVASGPLTTQATAITVGFDSVSGAFVVTSGITGVQSEAAFATGTLAAALRLTQATGAVLSQGADAATPAGFMTGLTQVTQDFALFMTAFDPDGGQGNAVKYSFAQWTDAQNDRFAYVCFDTDITPTESPAATQSLGYLIAESGLSGTTLVYEPSNLYHAWFVCGVAASIDFEATNGRITFAFRSQSGLVASVTNQTIAANLIANGYNFYGAYATAKQGFVFLYPGSVSGSFAWLNTFINEIWLNNALQLSDLELLTQINSIPYNRAGYAIVEASRLGPIQAAINFGAIRAGITLSPAQAAEVNNQAGIKIDDIITNQGFYQQTQDASPQVRAARGTPPMFLWYCDGEDIQRLALNSVEIQ